MLPMGTYFSDEIFHLRLSTVSETFTWVWSCSARSSSVTNFWHHAISSVEYAVEHMVWAQL